jgi:DNA-binding MarR family transcriptional regulator
VPRDLSHGDYRELAELRYEIRRFLNFSETAALAEGIEPRQHQALLAIKAMSERCTVGALAESLFLRHQSVVGLVDRLALRNLVTRQTGDRDARQVIVRLTPHGEDLLRKLSLTHRQELKESAPRLARALESMIRKTK